MRQPAVATTCRTWTSLVIRLRRTALTPSAEIAPDRTTWRAQGADPGPGAARSAPDLGDLLDLGVDLATVQKMAGHASASTPPATTDGIEGCSTELPPSTSPTGRWRTEASFADLASCLSPTEGSAIGQRTQSGYR